MLDFGIYWGLASLIEAEDRFFSQEKISLEEGEKNSFLNPGNEKADSVRYA